MFYGYRYLEQGRGCNKIIKKNIRLKNKHILNITNFHYFHKDNGYRYNLFDLCSGTQLVSSLFSNSRELRRKLT